MGVQFGKCNFGGRPVDPQDLEEVRPVLAPYGPDREGLICRENFAVLHRAFHTTKESRRETQPHVSESGLVITWDGRLDNREDLIRKSGRRLPFTSTDLEIVATAYEQRGTSAFRDLIGDWALSIWNPGDQTLILARDFVGTRQLFYFVEKNQVRWCTILDPLVLLAGRRLELDEEYIAGWLGFFPAPQRTPYVGIRAVPPSSFVRLAEGVEAIARYWDFDPDRKIRYRTDNEYEEHFRCVFSESVCRRLRSDSPVLAELSGGMDSSSIVCTADVLIGRGRAEAPRLDTVSYYNDSEPNWDERPYFTKVEQKRGRAGCHIGVGIARSLDLDRDAETFAATPQSEGGESTSASRRFIKWITSHSNRVLLSGVGGDEATGGFPTPVPELADLISRVQYRRLAHQLKIWALAKRKPWPHLLIEAIREFLPPALVGLPIYTRPPSWLHPDFVRRHLPALVGYPKRITLLGSLPSFQENLSALEGLRRQLGCEALSFDPPYERRYPYLDRDLLEFIYAIPRAQVIRPGQRRSLMRRSLAGVVPDEILNRRRKAFVARSWLTAISREEHKLCAMSASMCVSSLGIVDPKGFSDAVRGAGQGQEVIIVALMRALSLERWLRACARAGILTLDLPSNEVSTMTRARDTTRRTYGMKFS